MEAENHRDDFFSILPKSNFNYFQTIYLGDRTINLENFVRIGGAVQITQTNLILMVKLL